MCVCVCYLLAPWRAGVRWRGAGDVQRAGATAGGGGPSDPDRHTQMVAVIPKYILHFPNRVVVLHSDLDKRFEHPDP